MKRSTVRQSLACVGGFILLASLPLCAFAQGATAEGANAGTPLALLSSAFSGGKVVQGVELTGNATWYVGSLEDTGTVTLTASTGGSSQMQLALSATGQRTETQTGAGTSATCVWAGDDQVTHDVDLGNCWRPALWFLPALSLQPSLSPSYLATADLGSGTVGSGESVYRHLQCQLVLSGFPTALATDLEERSTTDIGLDPTTHLPAVLVYSVHPDSGAQTPIAIEIQYSDYRVINGAQIPFHIQRYVNGALQLDILVNSAQFN